MVVERVKLDLEARQNFTRFRTRPSAGASSRSATIRPARPLLGCRHYWKLKAT